MAVEPSAKDVARIAALIERRQRADLELHDVLTELYRAVREVCDEQGVTEQTLADALGVPRRTVAGWKKLGRQLG